MAASPVRRNPDRVQTPHPVLWAWKARIQPARLHRHRVRPLRTGQTSNWSRKTAKSVKSSFSVRAGNGSSWNAPIEGIPAAYEGPFFRPVAGCLSGSRRRILRPRTAPVGICISPRTTRPPAASDPFARFPFRTQSPSAEGRRLHPPQNPCRPVPSGPGRHSGIRSASAI